MDQLSNDILVEIWSRLPYKFAVRCKSISKRFLALISSPDFIERFIHRYHTHFRHINDEDHENEWSLIFLSRHKLLILFLPHLHLSNNPKRQKQLSLSFLGPAFDPKNEEAYASYSRIVGCSNGLLLCKNAPRLRLYYVCNLVTKQRVQLPLPPLTSIRGFDVVFQGFVCEPYYHYNVEGDGDRVTLNRGHRFRVVLIRYFSETKSEFEAVVFSSETRRWGTKLVSFPDGFGQAFIIRPGVAHGGRLYFLGEESLVVYDPFNGDGQCHTIDYPTDPNLTSIDSTGHVGVSCGSIRISYVSPTSNIVSVWELNENEDSDSAASWCLLHRTPLPPLNRAGSVRRQHGATNRLDFRVRVRAFHPYHGDVVFFQYAHRIFYGNLNTRQFDTAAYGIQGLQIIPLDLPWWPTPVPSIE